MFIVNNINCVHYCTKGHSDNTLQYDKRQQQDAIPVARIRPGRPETRRELQHAARDPKIPGNCLTQSGFEFGEPFLAELPVNTWKPGFRTSLTSNTTCVISCQPIQSTQCCRPTTHPSKITVPTPISLRYISLTQICEAIEQVSVTEILTN